MSSVWKIISLVLVSSVKFFLAPGMSLTAGFNFAETIAITTFGGILGTFVFYYFGEWVIGGITKLFSRKNKVKKPKKVFSRTNKLIVKTKLSYGLIGLALITPVILSIPVGSIVAARFFSDRKRTLPFLISSVILWSFLITSLISFGFMNPE